MGVRRGFCGDLLIALLTALFLSGCNSAEDVGHRSGRAPASRHRPAACRPGTNGGAWISARCNSRGRSTTRSRACRTAARWSGKARTGDSWILPAGSRCRCGMRKSRPAPEWMQRIDNLADFSDRAWAVRTTDHELYFIDKATLAVHEHAAPPGYAWRGIGPMTGALPVARRDRTPGRATAVR